jgi:putative ABC transport system permease protein
VIRAQRDAVSLAPSIRQAIRTVDRNQPILRVATMEERLASSEATRRFALLLYEVFGCVALVLAAIGTYSLLAGNVAERRREIGVRLAVGASRPDIVGLVRNGLTLAGLGIVIGAAAAMTSSRALGALLFGVSRFDSITYIAVIALLAGVSAIACSIPAWKATQVRPSIALRSD